MGERPRKGATYADLQQVPEHLVAELIEGVLHTQPRPVCEAVSPTTARHRARKMPVYARAGVAHVWIIDPLAKTLEVFRLDGDTYRLVSTHGGDDRIRAEPFGAIELELGALWMR